MDPTSYAVSPRDQIEVYGKRIVPQAVRPRAAVLVNGKALIAANEIEVTNKAYFAPDMFRVEIPLFEQPPQFGPNFWADTDDMLIEVRAGFANDPASDASPDLLSLIVGQADEIDIKWEDDLVVITGRDLSARFLDNKTEENFTNQTSSQVANTLAARRNLSANVAKTSTLVGTYYAQDHVTVAPLRSEWEILTYLAEREEFDVWVSGTTLNFQPHQAENAGNPYVVTYVPPGSEIMHGTTSSLRTQRSLTLAKDIIVKVRSWKADQKAAFVKTAKASNAKRAETVGGQSQIYTFTVAGLTPDQAQSLANTKLAQLTKFERVIEFDTVGDSLLTPRSVIQLTGTRTAYDQRYFVDEVSRRISVKGYTMRAKAKNHSPQSVIVV